MDIKRQESDNFPFLTKGPVSETPYVQLSDSSNQCNLFGTKVAVVFTQDLETKMHISLYKDSGRGKAVNNQNL